MRKRQPDSLAGQRFSSARLEREPERGADDVDRVVLAAEIHFIQHRGARENFFRKKSAPPVNVLPPLLKRAASGEVQMYRHRADAAKCPKSKLDASRFIQLPGFADTKRNSRCHSKRVRRRRRDRMDVACAKKMLRRLVIISAGILKPPIGHLRGDQFFI